MAIFGNRDTFGSGGGGGGSSSSSPSSSSRSRNTTNRSRRPRRPTRVRNRGSIGGGGGGGGGGAVATGTAPEKKNEIGTNPFDTSPALDTAAGEITFEDDDNLRNSAWGMLNNAGISQTPAFGGNAVPWLEGRVNSWVDEHRGNVIADDPKSRFENLLYDKAGVGRPDPALQPVDFDEWLTDPIAAAKEKAKRPGRPVNPITPVANADAWDALKVKPQRRLQTQYDAYAKGYKAPEGLVSQSNFINQQWNPAMRQMLARDWEGQTAQTRGYDSSRFVRPKRTIQF
jgi:hypothetical protein